MKCLNLFNDDARSSSLFNFNGSPYTPIYYMYILNIIENKSVSRQHRHRNASAADFPGHTVVDSFAERFYNI